MNMKSRVFNSSSNSSRFPRLHQRLQRDAIVVELRVETLPDELFSRHTPKNTAQFSLLARAHCVHANGGRPAQGGSTKCCKFCNRNRSVCTQSIVRLLQPRRSSETCAKCYNLTVQEML
jgi:hypothetical protein